MQFFSSGIFWSKALSVALGISLSAAVMAHGEAEPRFGGIVKAAQDVSFELVPGAGGGAQIYLDDHGKPMSTTGVSGKLTIVGKDGRKDVEFKADGKKLTAAGARPKSGDNVVVVVVLPSKKTISVRYVIP